MPPAVSLFKPMTCSVEWLINNISHGDLGLPEIQRPFVWSNVKVRDLFDSMYRGYPVGFLLFWAAMNSASRQIGDARHGALAPSQLIIDGQQRLTSLYAVLKNVPVKDENFRSRNIKIAFQPIKGEFEVTTASHEKSAEWIANISELFTSASSRKFINAYLEKLESSKGNISQEEEDVISENIERLFNIKSYNFSALEIDNSADIETVAEIFVRVNSGGQKLNQSDFILTLMSVFWDKGRNELENFCKDTRVPSTDKASAFNYFIKPEPGDLLRVPVILAFRRARLKYGYQVLLGKDFDNRAVSPELSRQKFEEFKLAQEKTLNLQNWKDFLKCLYAAGFRSAKMVTSNMAVLYSYSMFLIGKYNFGLSGECLMRSISRWFFMVSLTSRYSTSPETEMEKDLANLRGITSGSEFMNFLEKNIAASLTPDYWNITLPNNLATSSARSPSLSAYYAALILEDANVLFSNLKVGNMIEEVMKGYRDALEKHHLFPKAYLKDTGFTDDRDINQIANYALVEWNKNVEIGAKPPAVYFPEQLHLHGESSLPEQERRWHALPENWENMNYPEFLEKRRQLMAAVIKEAFKNKLCHIK